MTTVPSEPSAATPPLAHANDHGHVRPTGKASRRARKGRIATVLVGLSLVAAGVFLAPADLRRHALDAAASVTAKPSPQVASSPSARGVRVMTVTLANTMEQRSLTGVVVPRYETQLGFRIGGKISQRLVEAAQQVKAGDLLFRLDDADYALAVRVAEADVAALDAQARQAAAEEKRQRDLLASGFATRSTLDRVVANASATAAQVKAAQQRLMLATNQLGYVELRAPHDGIVTGIRAEAGQVVPQGQPVVILARSEEREALVGIPEGRVQDLPFWQARTAAGAGSGGPVELSLREVAAQADPASRTFAARYSLPSGQTVAPALGSTIIVDLWRRGTVSTARLPASAVMINGGEASVWVMAASGDRPERRSVGLVTLDAETAIVTGLDEGQQVITLGVHRLDVGMAIRVIETTRMTAAQP